jgi:hypothetical protein
MNIWKELRGFFSLVLTVVAGLFAVVPIILGIRISVPDSIFLSLILALIILFFRLAYIINSHTVEYGRTEQKKAKVKSNSEVLFILRTLADKPEPSMERKVLSEEYISNFGEKKTRDFNLLISKLKSANLIYMMGVGLKDTCGITDDGYAYYNKHRSKDKNGAFSQKKVKAEDSNSPAPKGKN